MERIKAMKKLMLITLSTFAVGTQAANMKQFYVGGGLGAWNVDGAGIGSSTLNLKSIEGIAGYNIFPWLAIEGRAGTGIESEREITYDLGDNVIMPVLDSNNEPTDNAIATRLETNAKTNLTYFASLYAKPQIINDKAALYGLIGVTTYDISSDVRLTNVQTNYVLVDREIGGETVEDIPVPVRNRPLGASNTGTIDESEVAMSLGIGVSFFFDDITVNAEWKNYIIGNDDANAEAEGFSANVTYSF